MEETDNVCFVCDKTIPSEKWKYKLQVTATKKRNVPVADLIIQLVGDEYAVLVGERDAVCSRCMNLLNLMDSLTVQLGEVQTTLSHLLHSKYNLTSESTKFQVEYDDSTLEESEPLHKCDDCSFQTKYEKEFNIHCRTHTASKSSSAEATAVKKSITKNQKPTLVVPQPNSATKRVSRKTTKFSPPKVSTRSSKTQSHKKNITPKSPVKHEKIKLKKVSKPKKTKVVFQCSVCDKIFSNENLIRAHAKKVHGNDKISVSEDEYEDIQTLESSDEEVSVPDKAEIKKTPKKNTVSNKAEIKKPPKKNTVSNKVGTKKGPKKTTVSTKAAANKKGPKKNTVSNKAGIKKGPKKNKMPKSVKTKLDFLDDWEEDYDNDDLPSPAKKIKIQEDDSVKGPETKSESQSVSAAGTVEEEEEGDDDNDTASKPTCLFCHATFSSVESVQDHIKLSHTDKTSHLSIGLKNTTASSGNVASFEIDSTTDIVENKKQTVEDSSIFNTQKSYKCNLCGIKKVSLQFIQQHIKAHKRKLSLQCKFCGTSFKNVVALKVHSTKCNKAASIPKKCSYCKFKFFDNNQLKNHIKNVHPKEPKRLGPNKNGKSHNVSLENSDILGLLDKNMTLKEENILSRKGRAATSDSSKISFSEVSSTSFETDAVLVNQKFSCSLCDVVSKTDFEMKEHFEKHHGVNEKEKKEETLKLSLQKVVEKAKLECQECGTTFLKPSRLNDHLNRHKASTCLNLGICIYCNKLFLDKEQVLIHTNIMHDKLKTKPKCPTCGKIYSFAKDLKIHYLRAHFSEKTAELIKQVTDFKKNKESIVNSDSGDANDVYSKVFKELQDITGEGNDIDMNVDGNSKMTSLSYSCPICNFNSLDQGVLKNHLKSHTQNYCNICQSIFSPQESIKHIENHSIEFQDKKCSECEEKFHDDVHLQFHIQNVHPERKPHKCSMCLKSYFSEKSMLIHKETKHGKKSKKVFSCSECKMDFYSEKSYDTHIEFAHRSSLNCKYCDKTFGEIKKLVFHERNHLKQVKSIYKCNICGKVLKTQSALRNHKNNHTSNNSLQCDVCNQSFKSFHTLREHSAKHSDSQEKKYFCDICGKGFYFYDSHYRHRRLHLDPLLFQCKICRERFQTNVMLVEHKKTCNAEKKCNKCCKSFSTISELKKHVCLQKQKVAFSK